MRDIIWTLIVIWLIYKLVDIFKSSKKNTFANNQNNNSNTSQKAESTNFSMNKNHKDVIQKSTDKEGDYIDFEEIK